MPTEVATLATKNSDRRTEVDKQEGDRGRGRRAERHDGYLREHGSATTARLRSVDAPSGGVVWATRLTADDVQTIPPPNLGDVSGDGEPELVVAGNDGTVSVVDPDAGTLLVTYERDVSVYTHATLRNADGDAAEEMFVVYADGRVVALDYVA